MIAGGKTRLERVEFRLQKLRVLSWAREYVVSQGATLPECVEPGHEPRVVRARHRLYAVLLHTLGLSQSETARIFEVDRSTVVGGLRKRYRELEAEHAGRAA